MLKTQELSIFDEVNLFFDDSADRLDLNDGLREMLKRSWRELLVQVPVRGRRPGLPGKRKKPPTPFTKGGFLANPKYNAL